MDTEPGARASPDAAWLSPSEVAQRLDTSRTLVELMSELVEMPSEPCPGEVKEAA
jgi:hypothetical protein